jgi:hydroxymethylpyrimidine pyrophosphatase-like HAD family hydrolase
MDQAHSSGFPEAREALRRFLSTGAFAAAGAFITDLDGTAVLERDGRIFLPPEIEGGLAFVRDRGRPIVANTLRFPRSVMEVFGDEWHRATGTNLPLVSLKGSQVGQVVRAANGMARFEEWLAVPLTAPEIDEVLVGVAALVDSEVDDLLLFHYPRDWREGERIWTPSPSRIDHVRAKYRSATRVHSSSVDELRAMLLEQPICMIFLLVEAPEDRRMAYQHTARTSFITHQGIHKRSGAEAIASRIGFDLHASIGAGDAPTDDFLCAVGFAIIVGNQELDFRGHVHTARVADTVELGRLLAVIGDSL